MEEKFLWEVLPKSKNKETRQRQVFMVSLIRWLPICKPCGWRLPKNNKRLKSKKIRNIVDLTGTI